MLIFAACNVSLSKAAFSVEYRANADDATGSVPEDAEEYAEGDSVTVASRGTLARDGYDFRGWSTASDGTGDLREAGSAFTMGSADVVLYAVWKERWELRDSLAAPSDEIGFVVSGGTAFAPMIEIDDGATATWYFSGDHTSAAGTELSKSYTGTLLATLVVTPWTALKTINIGYDGSDGGTLGSTYNLAQQDVVSVQNLELAKSSLQIWCSSYNEGLETLDFTDFASLETMESYFADADVGLVSIGLSGTSALKRLCVENNQLESLDLSDCVSLEDLRGALNDYTSITFPSSTSNIKHICIRENDLSSSWSLPALSTLPSLEELYIWNAGRTGTLSVGSENENLKEILAQNNSYDALEITTESFQSECTINLLYNDIASAVLSGARNLVELNLSHNTLTELNLSALYHVEGTAGSATLERLNASYNSLTSEAIEAILAFLDEYGPLSGTRSVDLSGNAGSLSSAAASYAASLANKGWTVTTD